MLAQGGKKNKVAETKILNTFISLISVTYKQTIAILLENNAGLNAAVDSQWAQHY